MVSVFELLCSTRRKCLMVNMLHVMLAWHEVRPRNPRQGLFTFQLTTNHSCTRINHLHERANSVCKCLMR
jgi:predicted small integral membrane protein